jgi:hypothetical protein
MRQDHRPTPAASHPTPLRRRGILAALTALAAGALAKVTTRVAEATDNSALIVGQTNGATLTTTLDRNSADPNRAGLVVQNNNFDAI